MSACRSAPLRHGVGDLRLDMRSALEMLARAEIDLPGADVRRALGLSDGRAVVLAGLCEASAALGPALLQQAIARANIWMICWRASHAPG